MQKFTKTQKRKHLVMLFEEVHLGVVKTLSFLNTSRLHAYSEILNIPDAMAVKTTFEFM